MKSHLKLVNVTQEMDGVTVECNYSQFVVIDKCGSWNTWTLQTVVNVFTVTEERENSHSEEVGERLNAKIAEFENILALNTKLMKDGSVNSANINYEVTRKGNQLQSQTTTQQPTTQDEQPPRNQPPSSNQHPATNHLSATNHHLPSCNQTQAIKHQTQETMMDTGSTGWFLGILKFKLRLIDYVNLFQTMWLLFFL